jgi:hypothetical protein
MRLMCWDVDIVHRPDTELVDADYWSQLGIDFDCDPLFWEYLDYTHKLCQSNPAPTNLPMQPENMPYYRWPHFRKPTSNKAMADTMHLQGLLTDIAT